MMKRLIYIVIAIVVAFAIVRFAPPPKVYHQMQRRHHLPDSIVVELKDSTYGVLNRDMEWLR